MFSFAYRNLASVHLPFPFLLSLAAFVRYSPFLACALRQFHGFLPRLHLDPQPT
jgi:hypothetical protein